jgi:hypothetical protein
MVERSYNLHTGLSIRQQLYLPLYSVCSERVEDQEHLMKEGQPEKYKVIEDFLII